VWQSVYSLVSNECAIVGITQADIGGVSVHQLVGKSYVDEIMHGEVMTDSELEFSDICLV
jgi:hypothetical protein